MGSSLFKFSRARVVALTLGLGLFGSLAAAPASFAASTLQPSVGAACQPDGKINGGGSTFQTNAVNNAFTFGYQNDVCGEQPSVSGLFQGATVGGNTYLSWGSTDPSQFSFSLNGNTDSVQGMVAYNVSLGGVAGTNGSGAGLKRLSCRTDMFAGTDLPYNSTQLSQINSTPGLESGGSAPSYGCLTQSNINTQTVPPPYGPQSYGAWPDSEDTTAKAMSFPIAGGAVAFYSNLTNTSPSSTEGGCTTTPSGVALDLTPTELDQIWQGEIDTWNDPSLVATNSWLSADGCSGPIQRVVRADNSGTTAITMFTLNGYDKSTLCAAGSNGGSASTWYADATASSNFGFWPQGCGGPNVEYAANSTGTLESTGTGTSGSPALITAVEDNPGTIGYAELGLWGSPPTGDVVADLATPATQASGNSATFVSPGAAGSQSTCQFPTALPVGASSTNAVGLGTSATWSNTGTPTAPGKQDVADPSGGTGYPACGLTFDMVYTHQNENNEVAAPAGSSIAATPGCTITAPAAVSTSGDTPSGSTTITVSSTAGFPATGTLSAGGQTLPYTSITSTTFTLSSATSGEIGSGSSVSLLATSSPATSSAPGVNGACQTVDDSVSGITNDQLRTLYSYFTYMFSPLGQDQAGLGATNGNLQNQTLDPLPAAWLPFLEQGYQQNL